MHVPEEVDPRPLRRAERQRALAVNAPGTRRREVDEVGDRPRAALLRQADQAQQDLGRRLRVRQRAMTRLRVGHEVTRERRKIRRATPEQPPRERHRVDDGRGDAPAGQPHRLVVEEGHIEPCVVRDQDCVAGEAEELADDSSDWRRATQLLVPQAGQRSDGRLEPRARVGECLEPFLELE